MLTLNELARYDRQIMLYGFGEEGQEKLKKAKVFIAGAGGLGSPVSIYLTVAGVGNIKIVDYDAVELSNLNRQILHWQENINDKKVESAQTKLKKLNPAFPTNRDYPTRSKGVVEKCTFCAERLAKGQDPACVEAANKVKEKSMIFGDLADPDSEVRAALKENYSIRRKPELGSEPNLYFII